MLWVMTTAPQGGWLIPQIGYGLRVRAVRDALDLDQTEFAAAIGSTQGQVSRHEKMKAAPRRNTRMLANSIQLRFRVPAEWLLTGTVPQQRDGVNRHYSRRLALVPASPLSAAPIAVNAA